MSMGIVLVWSLLVSTSLTAARMSVMYAHDKSSDVVAKQCLDEMFPKAKLSEIQESDEPCIFFCVMKKFGIMSATGVINLDVYRMRLRRAQYPLLLTNLVTDLGSTCMERAEATPHNQDVCKKAKIFNDCTRLYKIML